jgi:hypothetical protein
MVAKGRGYYTATREPPAQWIGTLKGALKGADGSAISLGRGPVPSGQNGVLEWGNAAFSPPDA